jgi:hypothetical protein
LCLAAPNLRDTLELRTIKQYCMHINMHLESHVLMNGRLNSWVLRTAASAS